MSEYERQRIEAELKIFTSRNFEKPANCKDQEQIRFYIRELCNKIEELECQCNYVPDWAYTLLAQYNAAQNSILHLEFRNSYR